MHILCKTINSNYHNYFIIGIIFLSATSKLISAKFQFLKKFQFSRRSHHRSPKSSSKFPRIMTNHAENRLSRIRCGLGIPRSRWLVPPDISRFLAAPFPLFGDSVSSSTFPLLGWHAVARFARCSEGRVREPRRMRSWPPVRGGRVPPTPSSRWRYDTANSSFRRKMSLLSSLTTNAGLEIRTFEFKEKSCFERRTSAARKICRGWIAWDWSLKTIFHYVNRACWSLQYC